MRCDKCAERMAKPVVVQISILKSAQESCDYPIDTLHLCAACSKLLREEIQTFVTFYDQDA